MILELYAVLLLLSFFIVYLGFKYDNMYGVVGFFFIFLLSLVLISNSLQYQTGFVQIANTSVANITNTTQTFTYTNYKDTSSHWIGYFLALASSLGMIFMWTNPSKKDIRY